MNIESKLKKDTLSVKIEGRIDMESASKLEQYLKDTVPGAEHIEFDFRKVEYISSAGLRVFLWLKKQGGNKEDYVVIKRMNETVRSVFDLTGFSDLITIK